MWKPYLNDVIELTKKWPYHKENLLNDKAEVPLWVFSYGTGLRHILFIGRIHGHEPAGTSGIIAFLEAIMQQHDWQGNDITAFTEQLQSEFTLHFIPMVNPDAAARYVCQVKDAYPGAAFAENETDYMEYKNILTAPARDLYDNINIRADKIPQADISQAAHQGIALGTLYSEAGIELFYDWTRQESPQIQALTKYIDRHRITSFVDIHCHELPTNIYIPMTAAARNEAEKFIRCGNFLLDQLRVAGIACSKSLCRTPYKTGIPVQYAHDLLYDSKGMDCFLWEINVGYTLPESLLPEELKNSPRSLTRDEITVSVQCLISNFLNYNLQGRFK